MKTKAIFILNIFVLLSYNTLQSQNYTFSDFVGTWQGHYSSEINYIYDKPITMDIYANGFYTETTGYFMPTIYPNTQEVSYDAATNRIHWKYLSTVYAGQHTYQHFFYEVLHYSNDTLILHYNFWDDPQPNPDFGTLLLVKNNITTGIIKPSMDINVDVYPNPASDFLHITTGETIESLKLYNISMQLVRSVELPDRTYKMNVSDLRKGHYILSFQKGNDVYVRKIIVQ